MGTERRRVVVPPVLVGTRLARVVVTDEAGGSWQVETWSRSNKWAAADDLPIQRVLQGSPVSEKVLRTFGLTDSDLL